MNQTKKSSKDRLWQFFLLTFIFSWLSWLPGLLLTYDLIDPSPRLTTVKDILQWVGGIGPSLAALYLIIRFEGKAGVKTLFKRAFNFKLGSWYIPIFLLLPVLIVLAHVVNVLIFGGTFPQKEILSEPWWIPALLFLFYILQFGEELGWRGYALDRLQTRWGALVSSIVLGCIWALWHLPMFLSDGFGQHDNHLPYGQFFITLVLVSVLITWLQNNTKGSLVPAFVLHALVNLSGEVLPLIETNQETQGDYTAWIILNVILFLAVVIVAAVTGIATLVKQKS